MFGWVEFIAAVITGVVLVVAGYGANALSLGFSGKWSTEGVVMVVLGVLVLIGSWLNKPFQIVLGG